jgi:hypothetical protein
MKILTLTLWLCLGAIPALAQTTPSAACRTAADAACRHHGGPAPLIGLGIPVALAAGGVWLGAMYFKRKK